MKKNNWKQYCTLYGEFLKIGLFTIGGGMAMIPQIQHVVVNEKKWLSEEEMIDCIAVSQSVPGIIAINCGTYIGRKVGGFRGSLAATLGVITPSFFIIIAVVTLLGAIGENRYIAGAFTGIKAAVCGLILVTSFRMAKKILKTAFQWVLAIGALIAVSIYGITAVWPVIVGAIAGIIYQLAVKQKSDPMQSKTESEEGDI